MDEIVGNPDEESVFGVLIQGRELANQLKNPTVANSREACCLLLKRILSSYDKALGLVNCMNIALGTGDYASKNHAFTTSKSRKVTQRSSDASDHNHVNQVRVSKKRKVASSGWRKQEPVCMQTGEVEGPVEDGYNWRKYGQKDILGAIHPRAYYRCTYRNSQGCLATKQIQRTDEDPCFLAVIYKGKHTCIQDGNKRIKEFTDVQKKDEDIDQQLRQMSVTPTTQLQLKVETEEICDKEKAPVVSFPSTSKQHENVGSQFLLEQNSFEGTSITPYLSPATSESFYKMSPCLVNELGFSYDSELDFPEIISNPMAIPDFHFEDIDSWLEQLDFSPSLLEPQIINDIPSNQPQNHLEPRRI